MSTANDKALALLQKTSKNKNFTQGFEEDPQKIPNLRAEFILAPISSEMNIELQNLLEKSATEGNISNDEINNDHKNLASITTEIHAIDKQSVILHGERIQKAEQLLKKYRDGTFTKWLEIAYGNRQTPYRMLQYYELFLKLDADEQKLLSEMPKRAAYVLASRRGDDEKKIEIIKEHYSDNPVDIIKKVQDTFPLKDDDKRNRRRHLFHSDGYRIDVIRDNLNKLLQRKEFLNKVDHKKIEGLRSIIDEILTVNAKIHEDPRQMDIEDITKQTRLSEMA